MSASLIIFVKNPELGKVKTRLASTIGDEKALAVYKQLIQHTAIVAKESKIKSLVFFSQQMPSNNHIWKRDLFDYYQQSNGNLGDRIEAAFKTALAKYEKAIIIGSDCPGINPDLINEAIESLDKHDVIIGPALDGGYYLLGMSSMHVELFRNKNWSEPTVFEETIQSIDELGLSYKALVALSDVDYEEDWEGLKHLVRSE